MIIKQFSKNDLNWGNEHEQITLIIGKDSGLFSYNISGNILFTPATLHRSSLCLYSPNSMFFFSKTTTIY